VLAEGVTVAVPLGRAHGLHTAAPVASVTEIEAAVPPFTSHAKVADCPGAIVLGDADRLSVNGTVTVTVDGADVPPGPVAVIEYVVVAFTGAIEDPVVGKGPESSGNGTAGVMVTAVALVVAHVSVVVCPELRNIGAAVN
jgi:hypothetical protein